VKGCFVCKVQDKCQELDTSELEQIRDLAVSEILRRKHGGVKSVAKTKKVNFCE
jgi:hypothetical protein